MARGWEPGYWRSGLLDWRLWVVYWQDWLREVRTQETDQAASDGPVVEGVGRWGEPPPADMIARLPVVAG